MRGSHRPPSSPALWALTRFGIYELPSLDKRLQVRSHDIEWGSTADPTLCTGKFGIKIRNVSKRVVPIRTIQVSVWVVPVPPAEPGKLATYIDPARLVPDTPRADTVVRTFATGSYELKPGVPAVKPLPVTVVPAAS